MVKNIEIKLTWGDHTMHGKDNNSTTQVTVANQELSIRPDRTRRRDEVGGFAGSGRSADIEMESLRKDCCLSVDQ